MKLCFKLRKTILIMRHERKNMMIQFCCTYNNIVFPSVTVQKIGTFRLFFTFLQHMVYKFFLYTTYGRKIPENRRTNIPVLNLNRLQAILRPRFSFCFQTLTCFYNKTVIQFCRSFTLKT